MATGNVKIEQVVVRLFLVGLTLVVEIAYAEREGIPRI